MSRLGQIGLVIQLLLLAAAGGVVYVWALQNGGAEAQLSLDLGRAGAMRMAQPMAVTKLIGIGFGAGFGSAALFFGSWGLRHRLRAGKAERRLAMHEEL